MAASRRRQQRTNAVDIASSVAATFDTKTRRDWDRFIKTGELQKQQSFPVEYPPSVQRHIDRIRANGGRLIVEAN